MRRLCAALLLGLALAFGSAPTHAQEQGAEPRELPSADRAAIEKYLGKGVVGKALGGNPIADMEKVFSFKPGHWTFQFTSGEKQGKDQKQSFSDIKTGASGTTGRYQNGGKQALFLLRSQNGDISTVSEQDSGQGVISRFSPPAPIYVTGMARGDSKKVKIGVKVYDLSDPSDVTHSGSLDLTYSYVGVYDVTVPAGTYQAALIKWDYNGEVGPASIQDTQYRFLAQGVGVVAMVEKKNIAAMLIYHDHSKFGKVLLRTD